MSILWQANSGLVSPSVGPSTTYTAPGVVGTDTVTASLVANRGIQGLAAVTIASAATRDPALWPFATNSPWNRPIGTAVATSTGVGTGFWGSTWAGVAAAGKVFFPQVQSFCVVVLIGQNSDPLQTMIVSADILSLYSSQKFPRHFPASFFRPSGENENSIITPDHLTSMDMYNITFASDLSTVGYPPGSGPGWYNGSGNATNGGGVSINVDTKGPGVWNGTALDGTGDMGIILSTGDEATPTNVIGVTAGNPITAYSQEPAAKYARLGGLIRQGEMANGINHALAATVLTGMLNKTTPSGVPHVWPAAGQDGDGSAYGTTGPLFMGSLIMFDPSVNVNTLGLTTAGLNIALALQRYGAYIADTGGANIWQIENAATSDTGPTTNDDTIITQHLLTVTNSYNTTNGGPPRAPGIKLDQGDGTVNGALIAPPFGATWGGGNGRYP